MSLPHAARNRTAPIRATTRAARRRRRPRATTVLQYATLIVLVCLSFVLVLLMISMSLRPTLLIYVDFWGLPFPPTTANYRTALLDLLPSMWRTLWMTAVSILGVLAVSCSASFAFARMRFPGSDLIFYAVLAVMMIPGVILLTPHFILADRFGLRGSLWGLVLFYIAGGLPFAIFLISAFFRSQPAEIFEAAWVDGASVGRALIGIAIPLAIPILVTVAIFNFIGIYGDYVWPSLMLPEGKQTLLLALDSYSPTLNEYASRPNLGVQAAGYVFGTAPQFVIFMLGMKYFIRGVTSGAIKG